MVFLPPGYNREQHTPAAIRIISDGPERTRHECILLGASDATHWTSLYSVPATPPSTHIGLYQCDCNHQQSAPLPPEHPAQRPRGAFCVRYSSVLGPLRPAVLHSHAVPPRAVLHSASQSLHQRPRHAHIGCRSQQDQGDPQRHPLPNHSTHPEAHQPARGDSTGRTMAPPHHRCQCLPSDQRHHQLPASIPAASHGTEARRPPRSRLLAIHCSQLCQLYPPLTQQIILGSRAQSDHTL
jgi:hypothetical protein